MLHKDGIFARLTVVVFFIYDRSVDLLTCMSIIYTLTNYEGRAKSKFTKIRKNSKIHVIDSGKKYI